MRKKIKFEEKNDLLPRLLYLAKLSFRIKGHIKMFPGKKKLKEFVATKPVLHEILQGLFYFKF